MDRVLSVHFQKFSCVIAVAVFMAIAFLSPTASAANLSDEAVRQTINETMKTILSGEDVSPALQQKIESLRMMAEAGTLSREKIRKVAKTEIVGVLDEIRTSRYILKALPEQVNELFSPYLTWEEMRKITWEACSTVIKKGDHMVITIGTLAPDGTPWLSVPRAKLIPEVARLSDGKVKIKIYGGGIMGEDTDILRKMDIGQLDGCGCTALGVLKASPETSVFLLPGLFKNYDEVDYVFAKFRKRIDKSFAKRGYILAALIDTGFFHMFSKKKIASLDDIRKEKPLTWFGQVETTLFDELNINATPVAVPEVVSALSTGLADTNLAPAAWMLGMQAYQYSNYYIKQPLLYSPAAIIVSLNTKHRLQRQFNVSDTFAYNIQELIVFEVMSLETYWKASVRSYERKSLEAFEKKCGMKVTSFSPKDMETIKMADVRVQQVLAGKIYPKELLDEVLAVLEEYRATHPED
ncbi:MAG: TRAP transporter substrate-binding protein DctP [Thermodesulfobacteriota bacterium]|nr:TRAP transporter substrate-binding protein DctP [Thermodesulfobacteriota bacterium]